MKCITAKIINCSRLSWMKHRYNCQKSRTSYYPALFSLLPGAAQRLRLLLIKLLNVLEEMRASGVSALFFCSSVFTGGVDRQAGDCMGKGVHNTFVLPRKNSLGSSAGCWMWLWRFGISIPAMRQKTGNAGCRLDR